MKNTYKKGEIIRFGSMESILFDAYIKKLYEFHIKSREGVRYDGCQTIHYFTTLDNNTSFCIRRNQMNLTKKKAIELHRELWDWLYHYPSKHKADWPRWEANDGNIHPVEFDCFACEVCNRCSECLFIWPPMLTDAGLGCNNSYFWQWATSESPKTRKKYAKLIRDLKVRK